MNSFQNIVLPPLPPFNSMQDLNTSTSGGGGCKDPEEMTLPRFITMNSLIPRQEEREEESSESSEDESIELKDLDSFEEYDNYKRKRIVHIGRKIQKMLSKQYLHNKSVTMEWQRNIRSLIVEFVKMYLHDYHTDMYHHITAILLDCKAMAKYFGYKEEKEFILRGLKMIQEKSLSENIPAGGGGGPDYWIHDF
jgi:hypothetical protein